MKRFVDDLGRVYNISRPPTRVVSLVPSETYSLLALGAGERLVGRTDYCVEPTEISAVASVGGTKNPRVDDIVALRPDLVLANQEENSKRDILHLANAGVNVFVSFPRRVADGIAQLARLARILGLESHEQARNLIRAGYNAVREAEVTRNRRTGVRAFAPIWMSPLMTANADTYLSDMLELVGADNVFGDRERRYPLEADLGRAQALPPDRIGERDTRYPRVTLAEVLTKRPQIVLLPDEPHPFTDADRAVFLALDTPASANGAVVFCSGKDLCWPGAWSIRGIGALRTLIEPYCAAAGAGGAS